MHFLLNVLKHMHMELETLISHNVARGYNFFLFHVNPFPFFVKAGNKLK